MAFNGIGSGFNSYYSNWFNNLYKGSTTGNSTNDIMAIMKKADEVRSPEYRKKMASGSSDSELGTVKSEKTLSDVSSKLKDSANNLFDLSLKEIDDKDELVKRVTAFADDYNSTLDSLQKSNSVDALKEGVSMKNTIGAFAGALKRIGISVGSDNKISINADKLKKADSNTVASVLTNNYSVTGRVANRAEGISKAAMNKAMTTAFTQYYTQSGNGVKNYGISTGSFFDSLF